MATVVGWREEFWIGFASGRHEPNDSGRRFANLRYRCGTGWYRCHYYGDVFTGRGITGRLTALGAGDVAALEEPERECAEDERVSCQDENGVEDVRLDRVAAAVDRDGDFAVARF